MREDKPNKISILLLELLEDLRLGLCLIQSRWSLLGCRLMRCIQSSAGGIIKDLLMDLLR